jgi:DNA-binding transcriptional ArsR family regulator
MVDKKINNILGAPDLCEVFIYDAGKVERLRRKVTVTNGLSVFFKALADDTRLKVVYALSQEEMCVCDVATMLGLTVQAASHHLRFLRDIGLAKYRKEGKIVFYSLKDPEIAGLVESIIQALKERL